VRDNDPNKDNPEEKIKVMIHLANGGDNKLYRTVFDALTAAMLTMTSSDCLTTTTGMGRSSSSRAT